MPLLNIPVIKAWRHRGEPTRIHYTIRRGEDSVRHLYVDEGSPLYDVLDEHLRRVGYVMPKTDAVPA